MIKKIQKTEKEWREILTPEQFQVMREKATEKPFSCAWENHQEGEYRCAACDLALFHSSAKFGSGSGWPSYFAPVAEENVQERPDLSYGQRRIEITCARCDSHLGHVFPDGPPPTGKRYCINSVALKFKPKK